MEARGRLAAAGVALLALGLVALVVLASSSGSVHPISDATVTRSLPPISRPSESASPTGGTASPAPVADVPDWIVAAVLVIGIAFGLILAIALAWLLVWLARRLLRFLRELRWPEATQEQGAWDRVAAERLGEAVAGGLERIDTGAAADAIIACWVALEQAAASAGVARRQAETPAEFTVRVLALGNVSAAELETLADLYREARFSSHRTSETARARARAALRRLRDDLAAVAPASVHDEEGAR